MRALTEAAQVPRSKRGIHSVSRKGAVRRVRALQIAVVAAFPAAERPPGLVTGSAIRVLGAALIPIVFARITASAPSDAEKVISRMGPPSRMLALAHSLKKLTVLDTPNSMR